MGNFKRHRHEKHVQRSIFVQPTHWQLGRIESYRHVLHVFGSVRLQQGYQQMVAPSEHNLSEPSSLSTVYCFVIHIIDLYLYLYLYLSLACLDCGFD